MKNIIENNKRLIYIIFVVGLLFIWCLSEIYKLGSIPSIFVDEYSYMIEVKSLLLTGTDLHNYANPIYFKGPFGNGQSITYSLFAVPFVKLFGFSVFTFRLPMVILTFLNVVGTFLFLSSFSKKKDLAGYVLIGFITAPWVFISTRWVLDCNIAPIALSLGILVLLYSVLTKRATVITAMLSLLSASLVGLAVYGYIAGWLFIPLCMVVILMYLFLKKYMTMGWMLIYLLELFVICLPMIIFAYRLVIEKNPHSTELLGFTYPGMEMQRKSSFIDFSNSNGLLYSVFHNLAEGIRIYMAGSDRLVWNSVSGFGVIMPFSLLVAVVGMFTPKMLLTEKAYIFKNILLIQLITLIPSFMFITPNFNHWNFFNMVLISFVGFGMYYIGQTMGATFANVIAGALISVFGLFVIHYYFTPTSYFENTNTDANSATFEQISPRLNKTLSQNQDMKSKIEYLINH